MLLLLLVVVVPGTAPLLHPALVMQALPVPAAPWRHHLTASLTPSTCAAGMTMLTAPQRMLQAILI
jgi:hypothetical protein